MSRVVSMMLLWMVLHATLLAGCSRAPTQTPTNGYETQVADPQSGVIIRTHIDRDEIRAADRLLVVVEIEWVSPVTATLVEPDWSQSGWTLVELHQKPAQLTDTGFLAQSTYLIEPFLPGEYAIPIFGVDVSLGPDAEPYRIESLAMSVQVRSVLSEHDPGKLDPAGGLIDPRASFNAPSRSNGLLYLGLGGIAGVALFILWRLTRSSGSCVQSQSVYEQLEHVADGRDESDADAYDTLYCAFTGLDKRLQQTSEIRSMIEQCERARFSPAHSGTLDPRAMARHTLELLGATPNMASKGAA